VPIPADTAQFQRTNIVKRLVRFALYDRTKQDFVHNTAQIVAEWNKGNEDLWVFNNEKYESLGQVIFRTTEKYDEPMMQRYAIILELCI